MSKPKKKPARPVVPPNPRSRGAVHTPKPKKAPKYKTNWNRLDSLYQD